MKKLKKWKILSEEDISPSPWFPLFKQKVKLPNGKVYDDFYISRLGDVAMVLPVTGNREIIFVEQYKPGVDEIIFELPAGRIKKESSIEDLAILELEEETGIKTADLISLGCICPAPTKDSTRVYGFLARDVEFNSKQKLDETEEIQVRTFPLKEVYEMIKNGKIYASDTIALLSIASIKYPEIFKL
ncbi:NUDIX hydrolase [Candidatus Dojkabacteria bacterium]|nr:NUDIX hydrolase [Candidatus Dojkabacteria bacterium]